MTLVLLACLALTASASPITDLHFMDTGGGPDFDFDFDHNHDHDHDLDFDVDPKYEFEYAVKDVLSGGDQKEHWESRDGDKVRGSYSLRDSDGTKRVVHYEADDVGGFNAVVHKIDTSREYPHSALYGLDLERRDIKF